MKKRSTRSSAGPAAFTSCSMSQHASHVCGRGTSRPILRLADIVPFRCMCAYVSHGMCAACASACASRVRGAPEHACASASAKQGECPTASASVQSPMRGQRSCFQRMAWRTHAPRMCVACARSSRACMCKRMCEAGRVSDCFCQRAKPYGGGQRSCSQRMAWRMHAQKHVRASVRSEREHDVREHCVAEPWVLRDQCVRCRPSARLPAAAAFRPAPQATPVATFVIWPATQMIAATPRGGASGSPGSGEAISDCIDPGTLADLPSTFRSDVAAEASDRLAGRRRNILRSVD